jgi:hypothetical protein
VNIVETYRNVVNNASGVITQAAKGTGIKTQGMITQIFNDMNQVFIVIEAPGIKLLMWRYKTQTLMIKGI